jgi:hypothetical protein
MLGCLEYGSFGLFVVDGRMCWCISVPFQVGVGITNQETGGVCQQRADSGTSKASHGERARCGDYF